MLVHGLVRQGYTGMLTHGSAHGQALPYNVSNVRLGKASWLMFVRHPISRLLSGYLDKERLLARKNVSERGTPSDFANFVRHLTSLPRSKLDEHFKPQSQQCKLADGAKYHYLRVETMGLWYRQIMCMMALRQEHHAALFRSQWTAPCSEPPCCFVRTLDCGCELNCDVESRCGKAPPGRYAAASFGSFMRENQFGSTHLEYWYDEDLARRVNAWAREDYETFGYLPWRPGQQLQSMHR